MTQIRSIAEAEQVLASYIPAVGELLGKDLTLVRMKPILEALGNPHEKLKIIHIAGTSGKTSTSYYIASLLKQAGKRVGLTVSPHIDSVTERVQIDLQPLSEAEFCKALGEFLDLISDVDPRPTYFELLIAFVYWYFEKAKVDYAVIETGLGGSFDATNVAGNSDKVCVITDVGLDHMHVLGKTIKEIAGQKAGIIHPGNHVFMNEQSPAVMEVFQARALDQHAILNVLSIGNEEGRDIVDELPAYQQRNWALAYYAYEYLVQRDSLPNLTATQLAASAQVQVPGRMDIKQVSGKTIIMDGAHNEQKMTAFVGSFKKLYPNQKAAVLLSLKTGKEHQSVLPLLKPLCSELIITTFSTSHDFPANSVDPHVLVSAAKELRFPKIRVESDYKAAYQKLLQAEGDPAIIIGSFYLLSLIRPLIMGTND